MDFDIRIVMKSAFKSSPPFWIGISHVGCSMTTTHVVQTKQQHTVISPSKLRGSSSGKLSYNNIRYLITKKNDFNFHQTTVKYNHSN